MRDNEWIVWGSELSPFTLKLLLMCRAARFPVRCLPAEGSLREVASAQFRHQRLLRRRLPIHWPVMSELDELPQVPFLFGPRGENLYDSSALSVWLDREQQEPQGRPALLPEEDAAAALAICLVDEYADEFGLYMVHHNRWKLAAADNDAGERLAREFHVTLPPFRGGFARAFSRRQVRRLPYLFSVAPDGFSLSGLPEALQPPSRAGFPATHGLLEAAFGRLLVILEELLASRPFLFGERFTLADASVYGQLAMNLDDPSADAWMRREAPNLHAWLGALRQGAIDPAPCAASLQLDDAVMPLLAEICRSYVPLQQQNRRAFEDHRKRGETLFNEPAFWQGRALYDGTLEGEPFRAVVKTFQVRSWNDLRARWERLGAADRVRLEALLPSGHGLESDT